MADRDERFLTLHSPDPVDQPPIPGSSVLARMNLSRWGRDRHQESAFMPAARRTHWTQAEELAPRWILPRRSRWAKVGEQRSCFARQTAGKGDVLAA